MPSFLQRHFLSLRFTTKHLYAVPMSVMWAKRLKRRGWYDKHSR